MLLIRPSLILCLFLASSSASITRQECLDQGGVIVGDIGNGAIFAPDYICESSGAAPTDVVVASPGEPIASEGEVCCGGTGPGIVVSLPETLSEADCFAQNGVVIEDAEDCSGFPPIGTVVSATRDGGAQVCCPNNDGPPGDNGLPLPDVADRDEITRDDCAQEYAGVIVGDIGNGAIFETNYTCESSGLAPLANIVQDMANGNIAIDGEVCCGPATEILESPAARDEITRQDCEDQGGEIVGDIGDGAIFRADFVCESSGESPVANIEQEDPIAIEGEVCCASDSAGGSGASGHHFATGVGGILFTSAFLVSYLAI